MVNLLPSFTCQITQIPKSTTVLVPCLTTFSADAPLTHPLWSIPVQDHQAQDESHPFTCTSLKLSAIGACFIYVIFSLFPAHQPIQCSNSPGLGLSIYFRWHPTITLLTILQPYSTYTNTSALCFNFVHKLPPTTTKCSKRRKCLNAATGQAAQMRSFRPAYGVPRQHFEPPA